MDQRPSRAGTGAKRRTRDRYGRPLPATSPRAEAAAARPPSSVFEAFERGIESFDRRRFFESHECFEFIWRASPADERAFWKGLTQYAAALCHCQRGNAHGALALMARASSYLVAYPSPYRGVQTHKLLEAAAVMAREIQNGGECERLGFPRFPLG